MVDDVPRWLVMWLFGDDRPKAYGLLTGPPATGRETRQQRRRDARETAKRQDRKP